MHVFGLEDDAGEPRENLCTCRENKQTPDRSRPRFQPANLLLRGNSVNIAFGTINSRMYRTIIATGFFFSPQNIRLIDESLNRLFP